ncbi:MAG: transcriptional regulator GcvA [Burkholderiales bacterium]
MPSLDLLAGFEAAARHLSFTKAGAELFLTQSAVSRQIKELEDQLGVSLFHRRHRALVLTDAGQHLYAAAAQVLTTMRNATSRLKAQSGRKPLSVTTTPAFAALWLVPRLAGFTRTHPEVDVRITAETRVQNLERDGLDIAIRHGPPALAGPNAVRLFGERVFPVCSPKLLKKMPLREPADLKKHTLLQYDDPEGRHPWLHWKSWLEVAGVADLRPAATLTLSGYEQIIPAAVAGHGVALGRSPLVKDLVADRQLVVPLKSIAEPARAYFAITTALSAARPEVRDFVDWLSAEATKR